MATVCAVSLCLNSAVRASMRCCIAAISSCTDVVLGCWVARTGEAGKPGDDAVDGFVVLRLALAGGGPGGGGGLCKAGEGDNDEGECSVVCGAVVG